MISADIDFERNMKVNTSQKVYLQNRINKSRLIKFVTDDMQSAGITVKQHIADADQLIVSTVLSLDDQQESPVIVIANYTDIFVMLSSLSNREGSVLMLDTNKVVY